MEKNSLVKEPIYKSIKKSDLQKSFRSLKTNDIKILVPPHIKEGDKVLISSENQNYVENFSFIDNKYRRSEIMKACLSCVL